MSRSHFANRLGTVSRPVTRWRSVWLIACVPLMALAVVVMVHRWVVAPTAGVPTYALATTAAADETSSEAADSDVFGVVAALDAKRTQAFVLRDRALLVEVDAPGSPALEADRNAVDSLIATDSRVTGLQFDITSVIEKYTRLSANGEFRGLEVIDRRSGYRIIRKGVTSEVALRTERRGR